MVRPALDETIAATTRALRTAGLQASDLRAIVLVGGSSRIPLVAQLVTSALGRPVAVDTDPKHAIASVPLATRLTATGPGAITSPSRQTAEGLAPAQPSSPTAPGLAAAAAVSPFATPPPPTRSGPIRTPPPTPPPTSSIIPPPSMTPPPTTTPPPYVPPVTGPSATDGGESPPSGKKKRTGLVVVRDVAVALIAEGSCSLAVAGPARPRHDGRDRHIFGGRHHSRGGSGDISAPLESGLLSARLRADDGTVTPQLPPRATSRRGRDRHIELRRLPILTLRDNPDFSGKKAAAGRSSPGHDSADASFT
jgi:hypothetical protein